MLLEAERLRYGVRDNTFPSCWKLRDYKGMEWRQPVPILLEAKRLRCGMGDNLLPCCWKVRN